MANFYISDLHIGHENILRFDNRPFADVNEMNNKLTENWNARVHSNDTVCTQHNKDNTDSTKSVVTCRNCGGTVRLYLFLANKENCFR